MKGERNSSRTVVYVAIGGLFLSGVGGWFIYSRELDSLRAEFDKQASMQTAAIEHEISHGLEVIHAVAGLFDASRDVEREEFSRFVGDALTRHPEIRALEWIPRVPAGQRGGFVAGARNEGFSGFEFTELGPEGKLQAAGARPEYFPVWFVEPLNRNRNAFGFDLGSDPARKAALERARDTGELVASEPLTVVEGSAGQDAFLILHPVYTGGSSRNARAERPSSLRGFAGGEFRFADLVRQALAGFSGQNIDVAVFDRKAGKNARLLFMHHAEGNGPDAGLDTLFELRQHYPLILETPLRLPAREWLVAMVTNGNHLREAVTWRTWGVVTGGILVTVSLTGYILVTAGRRRRIAELTFELAHTGENLASIEADRALAASEMKKLATALEETTDGVMITDVNGVIEYANPGFEAATGYNRKEVIGQTPRVLSSGYHDQAFYAHLWRTILAGEIYRETHLNRRKDGSLYHAESTITPIRDDNGRITHFVAVARDITETIRTEERLHNLAYRDLVTGLPNRALFLERLEHVLAQRLGPDYRLAVMFIDLDRFKHINDTLGHYVGDGLLRLLPERLRRCVRKSDTLARLGGDEFAVLLENASHEKAVGGIARKLNEALREPFMVEGHELFISASIGISMYPVDGTDAAALLKHADVAMYRVKERDRNGFEFYSAEMGDRAQERMILENSLRQGLRKQEFQVYYQAQVDVRTGKIIGVEALLRWSHPEMGIISPRQFLDLLEETGLIRDVGAWLLETASAQARRWLSEFGMPARISVNLSARQLQEDGFSEQVMAALERCGLPPEAFGVEVTESVLMHKDKASLDNLNALHTRGIRVALDDFGIGYSSLVHLKHLPIDALKIDRSFVRGVPANRDDAAIVGAILNMAADLGLDVIAEGVETRTQLDFLQQKGCYMMQGYLFNRPSDARTTEKVLRDAAWKESRLAP